MQKTAYQYLGIKQVNEKSKLHQFIELFDLIRTCNNSKSVEEAVNIIQKATCQILSCDRAIVFLVDEFHNELVIRSDSSAPIRVPSNAGFAGDSYQTGVKVNVEDTKNDSRVKEIDGYKIESVLCLPIKDQYGDCIAVLQAMNKKHEKHEGKFTKFGSDDETILEHMAIQIGVALKNQILHEQMKRSNSQILSLLAIVKSIHSNMGINSLMFTITEKTPSLVDADRATLYLVDRSRNELWSLQGAVEVRSSMDKGLIGACATLGEVVNIADAWEDARFNNDYDKQTGYRTKSVLCVPIKDSPEDGSSPNLVGVLQVINKISSPKFTKDDEDLLLSFVNIAGKVLSSSQLFNVTTTSKYSEPTLDEFPTSQQGRASNRKSRDLRKLTMTSFREDSEEVVQEYNEEE